MTERYIEQFIIWVRIPNSLPLGMDVHNLSIWGYTICIYVAFLSSI